MQICIDAYLFVFPTRNTGISQVLGQEIKGSHFDKYSVTEPVFTLLWAPQDIGQDWVKAWMNHLLLKWGQSLIFSRFSVDSLGRGYRGPQLIHQAGIELSTQY